jgi:fermentation-respiration switch protein FrsA (DUF1100 family)
VTVDDGVTAGATTTAEIAATGLDLARTALQVHGVSADGAVVVRRQVRRSRGLSFSKTLTWLHPRERMISVSILEACDASVHA